ncbi:Metallo-dependent hydrolase [Epithele typhae]|uniref:Metallo-dependent hydrolase n=1 Tax=Epithele typhae TaxID=378194 RepID=UPI00200824A2|nr:Metallo-dependent hydrolase [Epithele typhae]KAH9915438.1 Metallo-dependent hydrolase [Epithele typhae]
MPTEAYLRKREKLIKKDRALRPDTVTSQSLTPDERCADEILRSMRAAEAESVWGLDSKSNHPHGSQQMFPGMEFLTAQETIIGTKVFDIISKMPKGGLLHAHLGATVRTDVLLKLGLRQPAMHVRIFSALTPSNLKTVLPQFRLLPQSQRTRIASITDAQYVLGSWVPIQNARNNFDQTLGGPPGFDRWVNGSQMIDPSEAYRTHNTGAQIWDRFEKVLDVSWGIIFNLPVFTEYIRELLLSSIDDGISYVEPRVNFWDKYMRGEDGEENLPHRVWVQVFERVVDEVRTQMHAQGRDDEFIGARIIYCTLRICEPAELDWFLDDCFALAQEFPHLIAGFDLVGREDSLKPLIYYYEPLTRFVERQKETGVHVPFIFHAGETCGDGSPADLNLYDAILLGTKRIGHGLSIYKHPSLMEMCKEKGICIEMCPISNEILRFTGSMPMHPLPAVLNHGVHVVLCSDDPAVFGNMGLSFDFFQVFMASEVAGVATLRSFVWDSITFSSLDDTEKEEAYEKLERRWALFVRYIIDTYESTV